jgi:hypothetical protein
LLTNTLCFIFSSFNIFALKVLGCVNIDSGFSYDTILHFKKYGWESLLSLANLELSELQFILIIISNFVDFLLMDFRFFMIINIIMIHANIIY